MVEAIDTMGKKQEGARLVVRAWLDAGFKARLLVDGNRAAAELGIQASNVNAPTMLTVVENTPDVHNIVVCTLCSCYPAKLLGLSPQWYKSRIYRCHPHRQPAAQRPAFPPHTSQLPGQRPRS
jgi:nitrile hydratase